jgi:putative endonuclease
MKTSRQALGAWGEDRAAEYLGARGYTIIERNARTPFGEIDLVTRHRLSEEGIPVGKKNASRSMIVFVEVKTRSSTEFGFPEQAVNSRKKAHMLASAQAYLQDHPELEDDWRVDVVAVYRSRSDRPPEIIHFENAI